MSNNHDKPAQSQEPEQLLTLHINGKCPTQREASRVLTTPAVPVDKDDLATKPLHSAVRGFSLLRKAGEP